MYGIGNSYWNYGLYSSMFGGQYGNYGNRGSSGGFGSAGLFGMGQNNPWNNMVPNYAGINYSLLGKYMSNNYSDIRDSLKALTQQEIKAKSFYSEFNSTFSGLKSAASALKSFSSDSVFRPTGYGSADSQVATVTTDNAASNDTFQLNVKQTAQAQSFATASLSSSGNTLSGKATLTLTDADGKKNTFDFTFDPAKNNKSYLSQVASAVNEKKLGITALVTEKDGKSTLTFAADKTGTDSQFQAEFTGSSAGKMALSEDQQARNAVYSVDGGKEQTSQSNDVKIGDGKIGVTLKGEGSTEISKKTTDESRTVNAVKKFADSYNKALAFLTENAGTSSSLTNLAYSLSTTRFQTGTLAKAGIAVDARGALSVDEGKLTKALKENPQDVEKLFGGANGLATSTYGKTVNAMNNSRNLYPQSPSVSYSNYMYGRDRSYISSYMNGLFLSSLI